MSHKHEINRYLNSICIVNITYFVVPAIRLNGFQNYGRVEIFFNGTWGGLCGNTWDMNDATVVCHQLGFTSAVAAFRADYVLDNPGPTWLDINCIGNESSIFQCANSGLGKYKCLYKKAGVSCSSQG